MVANGAQMYPRLAEIQTFAGRKGQDCAAVCIERRLICHPNYIAIVNTCQSLMKHFKCKNQVCANSMGPDQPCKIDEGAPKNFQPGTCLVNTDKQYYSCQGKFAHARRLCPCLPAQ